MGASEQSAEDLYENAPCAYLSAAPDGRIVRVNGTFLRWTGYAREDLVGRTRFQDLLTPGGRIYHETHYAPLLRMQGSVREIAVDIVAADGRRLPVLVNSLLVTDDGGEPQMVRTTLFDARERKAYERELLAARDRERELLAQSRDVALTLQRSLLAIAPPIDPRYTIAAHYGPAGELEVGGDWYDAFELADGKLAVVVGDVVGRGLGAATVMGHLRSAVRALALAGFGPEELTRKLDAFVEREEAAQFATVVFAEVDLDGGAVTLTAAGHLPPVLLAPGVAPRLFMGGRTTPLGVVTAKLPRTEGRFELPPGAGFVLYTDGLVERRDESIDTGIERLLSTIAERPGASPAELADAMLAGERGEDDVCVLQFNRTPG